MNVICIQTEAFEQLVYELANLVRTQMEENDPWVDGDKTMELLGISSKTTLASLRNKGEITYTRPTERTILYLLSSINEYLIRKSKPSRYEQKHR